MPKELVATGVGEAAFRDYEPPSLGSQDIRVKTSWAAAKHGTEMSYFKGYGLARGRYDFNLKLFMPGEEEFRFPAPLGNTSVGEVVEVGSEVSKFRVGDTAFAYGPFREIHTWTEDSARHLSDGTPWQAACCLDPANFAVGAVRDGHVRLGDRVVVFGMGAIGLCALQVARAAGARQTIAVEPVAMRRELALELGADEVVNPATTDVGLRVRELTDNLGADVCIEYSGHHSALSQALRSAAYGGTVVAGAFPGPYGAGLDFGAEAHFNRLNMVFSRSCSEPNPDYPNWDEPRLMEVAWELLSDGRISSEAIVQPVVPFSDLDKVYPRIATDTENYLKLGTFCE